MMRNINEFRQTRFLVHFKVKREYFGTLRIISEINLNTILQESSGDVRGCDLFSANAYSIAQSPTVCHCLNLRFSKGKNTIFHITL